MAEFKKLINPPIKASEIDSESATSGQVLQADGNGGASWQTPSGGGSSTSGGTKLYKHVITGKRSPHTEIFISTRENPYSTLNELSLSFSLGEIIAGRYVLFFNEDGTPEDVCTIIDILVNSNGTSGEFLVPTYDTDSFGNKVYNNISTYTADYFDGIVYEDIVTEL